MAKALAYGKCRRKYTASFGIS